ncbi:17-beta-hydroxysteroid dehydrogenase-like protein NDAI_0A07390 [Naumovozyma dairenensis CBS 421]|uniref:Glycoside hydrolase family 5 domain-containing protein n=1 Tax=Naumovozyma dairenensis (strain ATCC 10597 / BCRC 20456 / CBS 421 / NBRC 0211 / NRRL Y-12639) TaxID=1071378 RepID=G0W505_NAUDC|nr:hypothetical protein NDAI_0A07390 [Naumovozyma dairenensis CBS 421]CCD22893.1 hypothetical protein NDAI_0A07390 [Naumovozyma dairenensis CBS 421]
MFDKLKEKLEKVHISPPSQKIKVIPPTINTIDEKFIYRNRYNTGVNLGALFVLEKWIFNSVFDDVDGETEYDAVTNRVKKFGKDDAINKLKSHYDDYISRIDWKWLNESAGVTALRVPIGFWHVGNGKFLNGLPFESLKEVYEKAKAWEKLKELIKKAKEHHIGILIDMHGLPGGANPDSHSGGSIEKGGFFKNKKYVDKMCYEVFPFIVNDICTSNDNVIGLQIVNEAAFSNEAKEEKDYHKKAIKAISEIDSNLPIIISDGWWPQQWVDWLKEQKLNATVVIDAHVYRCFSDDDKNKQAQQICNDLPVTINFPTEEADFMVGEFSCNLAEEAWDKTSGNREDYLRKLGQVQTSVFHQKASFGYFFWTLQFQYGDGGAWGFVPMTKLGALPVSGNNKTHNVGEKDIKAVVSQHVDYWKSKGGDKFEHWRFQDGVQQAAADIQEFSAFNGSRLGRWQSVKSIRRKEYLSQKGDSEYMWEWDQGYDQGLFQFNN